MRDFKEEGRGGNGVHANLTFSILSGPLQYREGKKLRPKPNYNSVDLSEVEWEDQAEIVSGVGSFCPVIPVAGK